MEIPESNAERIKRLIRTLRSITIAVQIAPFVFSSLYILDFALYSLMSPEAQELCDTLFYTSPMVVCALLVFSRILHLCKWHRTACALPLIPLSLSIIDYYVIELTEFEALIFDAVVAVSTVLLLVAAYNVFLKPRRK